MEKLMTAEKYKGYKRELKNKYKEELNELKRYIPYNYSKYARIIKPDYDNKKLYSVIEKNVYNTEYFSLLKDIISQHQKNERKGLFFFM